ncbi:MAG: DUF3035 domain-containing protein [Alphaproteobacteria bacterium]|nr:DUF3035 domain-containing protein [Alphaproteobacteria bacterium]
MMKKFGIAVTAVLVCGALTACSATKESLGLSKKAPDEFMVSTRAPLSLPPEYNLLPVAEDSYKIEQQEARQAETEDMTGAEKKLLAKMER